MNFFNRYDKDEREAEDSEDDELNGNNESSDDEEGTYIFLIFPFLWSIEKKKMNIFLVLIVCSLLKNSFKQI